LFWKNKINELFTETFNTKLGLLKGGNTNTALSPGQNPQPVQNNMQAYGLFLWH